MRELATLQRRLAPVWRMSRPPGDGEHVRIVLPSYNLSTSAYQHYARRLPALEHRFLVDILQLARVDGCSMLFVLSRAPEPVVIDYYLSLLPDQVADHVRGRVHTLVVPERSTQTLAARLREQPDLLADLRSFVGERPAYIEPWNVTENEVAVAIALAAPLNGTAPDLWPLGFKSAGRRLFAAAGVPTPPGVEDVRTTCEVEAAIDRLREEHPSLGAVVVKLDNSVAGDGNLVIPLRDADGAGSSVLSLAQRVESMPGWYQAELRGGGVVEAYVVGDRFTSPSVQLEITPDHRAVVLATHEQVLGGANGQVYLGCRFPSTRDYAKRLTRYGRRVGERLATHGALGMLSVDFVASRSDGGDWGLYALEVNLRRGGTTPPMVVLSSLLPGRLDGVGRWRLPDGSARYYVATDNLVEPRWTGLPVPRVIEAVRSAGLAFDRQTGTGVVLHMLSGLAIDGRFGLTAIARSGAEAEELFAAVTPVVHRLSEELLVSDRTDQTGVRPSVR